jgi:molecular chaperone GrpE
MSEETQQPNNEQTELEQLKAQADEYLNGWKRAKADYINFKKETESRQQMLYEFANATLLMEILPIFDNLKKAILLAGEEKNNWLAGIKQIKKQMEDLLKDHGIEEIKTAGEKFNPEFHEAISKEKKEGVEPGTIIAESSSGYLLKGKVLVAAKVIVAE